VQADADTAIPELKAVIVVHDDQVVIDSTLSGALEQLFGVAPETLQEEPDEPLDGAPATDSTEPPTDDGTAEPPPPADAEPLEIADDVKSLLDEAASLFEQANAALTDGDLGEYQDLTSRAAELIERAVGILEDDTAAASSDSIDASAAESEPA
jgi:uncharacterized membrane protein (UPF0182 family)